MPTWKRRRPVLRDRSCCDRLDEHLCLPRSSRPRASSGSTVTERKANGIRCRSAPLRTFSVKLITSSAPLRSASIHPRCAATGRPARRRWSYTGESNSRCAKSSVLRFEIPQRRHPPTITSIRPRSACARPACSTPPERCVRSRVFGSQSVTLDANSPRPARRSNHGQAILGALSTARKLGSDLRFCGSSPLTESNRRPSPYHQPPSSSVTADRPR
jgi:hypothetical protein